MELPNRDLELQLEGKHGLGKARTFKQKVNRLLFFFKSQTSEQSPASKKLYLPVHNSGSLL